jgi:hypothetical protein
MASTSYARSGFPQNQALQPVLNEKAPRVHPWRVVSSFVGSVHRATRFYGTKVTRPRDLTMASQNDDRDGAPWD